MLLKYVSEMYGCKYYNSIVKDDEWQRRILTNLLNSRDEHICKWKKLIRGRFDELMSPMERDYDTLIVQKAGVPVDVKIIVHTGGEKVRKVMIHDDNNHLWNYLVNVRYADYDKFVLLVPEGQTETWEHTELWLDKELMEELDELWTGSQVCNKMFNAFREK